jgi:hypothetical protein
MIWVVLGDPLWNLMVPSVPVWTVTRFGMVVPGPDQFRLEAVGSGLVPG